MVVLVAFHYSSYGTFCVHSKSSIISTVVLPTTEIIEPLNDGAFLALDGTAYYTMETQSIGKALFGGQGGFFVMTTQGQGTLLANAYGSIKKLC